VHSGDVMPRYAVLLAPADPEPQQATFTASFVTSLHNTSITSSCRPQQITTFTENTHSTLQAPLNIIWRNSKRNLSPITSDMKKPFNLQTENVTVLPDQCYRKARHSFLHSLQIGSGAHIASYSSATRSSFSGEEAAGA
jgi:hypothetical protein